MITQAGFLRMGAAELQYILACVHNIQDVISYDRDKMMSIHSPDKMTTHCEQVIVMFRTVIIPGKFFFQGNEKNKMAR